MLRRVLEKRKATNDVVVDDDCDNDCRDDDYEEGDDSFDKFAWPKKKKTQAYRGETITIENDSKMEIILKHMGFYEYLRRSICKTKLSAKHATQTSKKSACFLAYIANHLVLECCVTAVILVIKQLIRPAGHQLLYIYLEFLSANYRPRTLANTVGYIKSLVEWGITKIPQIQNLNTSRVLFDEYADVLRRKVCKFRVYLLPGT
jgi:hypothetical protein